VDNSNAVCFDFDAENVHVEFRTSLPGEEEAIPPVVERIMEIVCSTSCAAGHEFEVELALTEAIANAVRHGCAGDPQKSVDVCVACQPDRGLMIIVSDPGSGFDPDTIADPVAAENLYKTHGRGIFLINQLMDEVEYERGGAVVRMRKVPKRAG
jgi:serine/threonine-protein kinase RsbW